uniref:ADP-ribosylation factor (ARF) GTP-ase activating protein, putative n=1 Tax=Theileria annulata TaxID=5874 RepID=A0A3B0MGV3_THEAN
MDWILSLKVDQRGFVSEADREEFFRRQFRIPENTTCFECGFSNPKWLSLSFAIYLCLNCSGRHRQLGSHISFVRSVDMDRFMRDQLIRLYVGGNQKFNAYLSSENLLQKPTDYDNSKVLSYSYTLDDEVAKARGEKVPEDESPTKQDESPNLDPEQMQNLLQSDQYSFADLEKLINELSLQSSLKDDAEKFADLKNLDFSDLNNLEIPSFDPSVSSSAKAPEQGNTNDNFDFSKFDPSTFDPANFNFENFSEFASNVQIPNTIDTNDAFLNMDFPNEVTSTSSFNQIPNSNLGTNKSSGSRRKRSANNKFSSKAEDFDFETFEKENNLESAFPGPSLHGDGDLVGDDPLASFVSPQSASPNQSTSFPFSKSPPLSSTIPSTIPFPVGAQNPLQSTPLTVGGSSPLDGSVPNAFLNNEFLQAVNSQNLPDLSKFEGKSSISSDAFFGANNPQGFSPTQFNPETMAFSSDEYFGKPRPPNLHYVPTIEEQALQNLNELRENLVNAISKGGALLEKAKQWLNTNQF